jgi:ribosomal protein L40E
LSSVPRSEIGDDAGSRPAELRCPDCGARNAPGAQWCGQCLTRFGEAPEAEGPKETGGLPAAPDASPRAPVDGSPFEVDGDVVTWRCSVCEARNPLEAGACSVCGAELALGLRSPSGEIRRRDPGMAALLSLFLPGAGHAFVGQWGQAAARAVTSTWVLCMALMFAFEQGPTAAVTILFGVAAFGLWAVGGHDAYREAAGDSAGVILRGRSFMFVFLSLVGLSVVAVFVSAFAALGA